MSDSETSQHIEVDVPVSVAYNQWTQFEEFPRFMDGVEEVQQLTDDTVRFTVAVGPKKLSYDAQIVTQEPDQQIAWRAIDGKKNLGVVTFQQLGPNKTRVGLRLGYELDGIAEKIGDMLGFVDGRVKGDLKNFKEFIEAREQPTGAWRGNI